MQEIFGVNHHIRDMADRFGAQGYRVVAPAVFDRVQPSLELGYTPDDIAKGRDERMKLNDAALMQDIEAAADFMSGKKLGIVGYCFGGTVAWWGATRTTNSRGFVCRRRYSWDEGRATKLPGADAFRGKGRLHPDDRRGCGARRTAKGRSLCLRGAQHGFGCDERASYSKPDYDLAQQRTLDFFGKHLG